MKLDQLRWIAPTAAAAAAMVLSAILAATIANAAPAANAAGAPVRPPSTPAAAPANGATASGQALFQENCGGCHDLTVTTDQRKSRGDWQATVSRMVTSGAALSDAQAAQVVDYLTKNYGAT